jgi:hypothetical protein
VRLFSIVLGFTADAKSANVYADCSDGIDNNDTCESSGEQQRGAMGLRLKLQFATILSRTGVF